MHSISEVIILNNDRHQHKKKTSTNNRINSKINQHFTPFFDWGCCGREVLFEKVFVYCFQVYLAWKIISCQTDKGNRVRRVKISQGISVWRMVGQCIITDSCFYVVSVHSIIETFLINKLQMFYIATKISEINKPRSLCNV